MQATGSNSRAHRPTVLIAEDEPSVLCVLAAALKQAGYEVLQASCGEDALALCRARGRPVDLLLTDVIMPGMNGVELADRFVAEWPGTRVLCTAGMPGTPEVKRLIDSGYAFIPKPFLPRELMREVARVLSAAPLSRAAGTS